MLFFNKVIRLVFLCSPFTKRFDRKKIRFFKKQKNIIFNTLTLAENKLYDSNLITLFLIKIQSNK
jgi:hypothetical protein